MNKVQIGALQIVVAAFLLFFVVNTEAYDRYNDGCNTCHGQFTGSTSPKGSVFPSGDKHEMHRGNSNMNTECDLCHTSGDGRNPFIGSSDGTNNNTGYGCVGCHGRLEDAGNDSLSAGLGAGLRQHHYNTGITGCANCHTDSNPINYTPVGEHVFPPYFGTVDTNADMPCNPGQTVNANENWTTGGDFIGLDNDGDVLWDAISDPDCMPVVPTPGDINFDGKADILWRSTVSGQNWAYLMNGAAVSSNFAINAVASQAWQIVGNGDYDGDGDADVLWRNSTTGQNWMYLMNGGAIDSSVGVNTVADQAWQVAGNGDYNGDGNADILLRNNSTGQNWMYLMNGASISSSVAVNTVPTTWQIAGNGDYNGDNKSDILWRHSGTGQVWMYLMNGSTIDSSSGVGTVAMIWQIVGNGDYNADGKSDILWRRESNGQNWMYLMNGSLVSSSESVNTVASTQWQVRGSGDYDGDGDSDILWRNASLGQNWMYLMNGSTIDSSAQINVVSGSQWQIVNVD